MLMLEFKSEYLFRESVVSEMHRSKLFSANLRHPFARPTDFTRPSTHQSWYLCRHGQVDCRKRIRLSYRNEELHTTW